MSEQSPDEPTEQPADRGAAVAPGVALLAVCAVGAWLLDPLLPVVDVLLIAVVVGFGVANVFELPTWAERGVETHKVFLGAAIVLMGASLSVDRLVESGALVVSSVVCVSGVTLVGVELCSRRLFGIDDKLASLLAAGSSICGVSAIVAVAGSIRARDEHVVYAATTILLFDAVTLLVYPVVGNLLAIPSDVFGMWAGVSMFSTGPVVAVGFAHSETAGQWATLTKLARNTLIGLVAVGYATYYARRRLGADRDGSSSLGFRQLWDRFPKYVVGFAGLVVLASSGVLTAGHVQSLENAYNWLFLLAFVGLGTEIRIAKLRRAGVAPVLVVLCTFCAVSVISLVVLSALFG